MSSSNEFNDLLELEIEGGKNMVEELKFMMDDEDDWDDDEDDDDEDGSDDEE